MGELFDARAVARGPGRRLVLRGDLDARAAQALEEVFESAGRASEDLVVEVSGVTRAAAAGLRVLAHEEHRRSLRGGSLRLAGAAQPLLRLLAGAGLLHLSRLPEPDRISA
jgi:anti-anti-sigma factor